MDIEHVSLHDKISRKWQEIVLMYYCYYVNSSDQSGTKMNKSGSQLLWILVQPCIG